MNERIKELIEQATTIDYGGDRGFDQVNPQATFDKEKFAELIVKECMELTHWRDFDMCVEQRIRLSVAQDIKEHFGVSE